MSQTESKIKIGFLLTGDYLWIGGLYYVLNLLKALALNNNNHISYIALTRSDTPAEIISVLNEYKIEHHRIDKFSLLSRVLFRYPKRIQKKISAFKLDVVYPLLRPDPIFMECSAKVIFWIPDFQHKFYPEFFTDSELNYRNQTQEKIAALKNTLILSSNDALQHFKRFYPNYSCNTELLHFRSIIVANELCPPEEIVQKYPVNLPYFMVCNQFWKHKNHRVVIDSVRLLANKGLNYRVILTGKADRQFPEVFEQIKSDIERYNLQNVHLAGFISRADQLQLMNQSLAIIQPSKFEGWSTVNEDARTLGVSVIAADLAVNREQMGKNAHYFDADNPQQLANLIEQYLTNPEMKTNALPDNDFSEYSAAVAKLFSRLAK